METMRLLPIALVFTLAPLFAQTSDEKDALAAVQQTFDAMTAHDAAAIRSSMLPDARLYAIGEQGAPSASISADDFATRIAAIREPIVERFTSRPSISIHGRMAQVWGEYEFLREGKFHHCGVDSFSLFKTAEGWKVATIVYTSETTGCKNR
jgi:Putative lumazine-binding